MATTTSVPSEGSSPPERRAHTLGELVGARGARIHWGRAAAFLVALLVGDLWNVLQPLMGRFASAEWLVPYLIRTLVGDLVLAAAVVAGFRWIRNDVAAAFVASGIHTVATLLVSAAIDAARSSAAASSPSGSDLLWQAAYTLSFALLFVLALSSLIPRIRRPWLGLGVGAAVGQVAGVVVNLLISHLRTAEATISVAPWLSVAVLNVCSAALFAGAFWLGLRRTGLAPPAAGGRFRLQAPLAVWAALGLSLVGSMGLIQVIAGDSIRGDQWGKTTAILGALSLFSLTALASALRFEKAYLVLAGWLGMVSSAMGLALTVVVLLLDRPERTLWQLLAVAAMLASAAALGSLVLLTRGRTRGIDLLASATFWLLSLHAAISSVQVLSGEWRPTPGRLDGLVSIVAVVGLVVTPLLARHRRVRPSAGPDAGPAPTGGAIEVPMILASAASVALLGVMALLQVVGGIEFGDTETRLTALFASVALFSLTALASAACLRRGTVVGWGGVAASTVGLPMMVAAILSQPPDPTLVKAVGVAVTLAVSTALSSLILPLRGRSRAVDVLVWVTAAVLAASGLLIMVTIVHDGRAGPALAALLILTGVGLGTTPLLARLDRLQEAERG
jgi:hypothetical protein